MNRRSLELKQEELLERYASGERDFSKFQIYLKRHRWHSKTKIRVKNDLSGINLSNAIFNKITINCNLSNANFAGSNLSNAHIGYQADFTNANVSNANLSNAKIGSANFSNAILRGADLSNASFVSFKNQQRINFSGADLTNVIFANDNKRHLDFTGVDLSSADLSGVDLSRVILTGAILKETKLENAVGVLSDEILIWKIINGHTIDESIADFDLSGANFVQVDLKNINLSGANLSECIFVDSNLENADLRKANLEKANFSYANLTNADLSESNLTEAIFYEANLSNTNLNFACLDKAINRKTNFQNAINVPESFLRSQVKTPLIEALDKIFDYHYKNNSDIILCLQPGLTREEIDELLIDIPYTIPEELYQLYEWRNGMNKKGIQNYGCLAFAMDRGFLPLEEVVKQYKYTSRYYKNSKKKLELFPPANDYSTSYTVNLGDDEIAPVHDFDTEHNFFGLKHRSIFDMMSSCNRYHDYRSKNRN